MCHTFNSWMVICVVVNIKKNRNNYPPFMSTNPKYKWMNIKRRTENTLFLTSNLLMNRLSFLDDVEIVRFRIFSSHLGFSSWKYKLKINKVFFCPMKYSFYVFMAAASNAKFNAVSFLWWWWLLNWTMSTSIRLFKFKIL